MNRDLNFSQEFPSSRKLQINIKAERQEVERSRRQTAPQVPFSLASTVTFGRLGSTPIPSHAQLVLSNTGTHFTYNKWMES